MEDMGNSDAPVNHKKSKKRKKHKPKKPIAPAETSSPDSKLNSFHSPPPKTEEVEHELGAAFLGQSAERLPESQNSVVLAANAEVSALPSGKHPTGSVVSEEQPLPSRNSWLHHSCHKENNLNRAVEENHCNSLTENSVEVGQRCLPDLATNKPESDAGAVGEKSTRNSVESASFENSEKVNAGPNKVTLSKKVSVKFKDDRVKDQEGKMPECVEDKTSQKTKAQLKAERKATFEAQHGGQLVQKPKGEKSKAERRALQEAQRAQKASKSVDSKEDVKVTPPVSSDSSKASKPSSKKGAENQRISESPKKTVEKKVILERPSKSGQKKARLFSHLPQYQWDEDLTADLRMSKNTIHPAVIRVGLQIAQGLVTGSNARSVAMLLAFQQVIKDYDTPAQKELSRDLEAKLQPYVSFLNKCRPLSAGMENEVKKLKWEINHIPSNMSETEAKKKLCDIIETNITNDITLVQKAIYLYIHSKIVDGDVILTYSCSSVVKSVLADAHFAGKRFQVVVVDSRPRLEGREMVRYLVKKGIPCSYVLINAVSYVMKEVTKVILGAYSLQANGYVMSRVGTSQIALIAQASNVPVLVCCETYKFCERVHTDSFVYNELGNPNDLVTTTPPHKRYLENWKEISSLRLLNLTYDVTPPNLVTAIITDLGMLPCTSAPVVLRVKHVAIQEQ